MLTEKDGYFYGRGTSDIKDMAAIYAQTLIRAQAGTGAARPRCDPRPHGRRGRRRRQRGPVAAGQPPSAHRCGLRDQRRRGRSGSMRDGKVYARNVQASEKVYMDLRLEVRNPGRPQLAAGEGQRDLPARRGAHAVRRVRVPASAQRGHARLLHPSRRGGARHHRRPHADGGRERRHRRHAPAVGGLGLAQPILRTTCVATRLDGGPREQRAAPDRRRERELPDAAGRAAGGGGRDHPAGRGATPPCR